jgi:CO/xanthine dehydrogenase FAD-binding subunit
MLPSPILDVTGVAEMRGIAKGPAGWRLGGASTWSEIAGAALPAAFAGLQQAARQIGARQIQNRGTLAGNLCNASPAADGVPPLLTLDAQVELASHRGVRHLPLVDFITGYRKTARRDDEILSAVIVPDAATCGRSAFSKLGARSYLVISIIMVAVRLEVSAQGRVATARVAVGAAADRARRLAELERDLEGCRAEDVGPVVAPAHLGPLSPIDDVRASAAYRRDAALALIADTLQLASGG